MCVPFIFKDKLNEDVPLPRPDKMTLGQISAELSVRGLLTTGSRQELNARLEQDDLSKKFIAKYTDIFIMSYVKIYVMYDCM